MNIMGLNGWTERGHDGGVALLVDGELQFAIEEERLSKIRHAYDQIPVLSINQCLRNSNLSLDDIDYFAIGWDYEAIYEMLGKRFISRDIMSERLFGDKKYADRIVYVPHHISHAYSTFVPSNYENALVLVIDGQGEYMGTSIYWAENNNKMELLMETPASLGYFYSGITKHIGFNTGEEGKTMGLAPYGKPIFVDILTKQFYFDKNQTLKCFFELEKTSKDEEDESICEWENMLNNLLPKRYGSIEKITSDISPYANLASSAQKALEGIVIRMISYYSRITKVKNVCLAGGVGLNCPLASKIESLPFIENVFTQPAANDGGVSLGAAIKCALDKEESVNIEMIPYLGPRYDDCEIEKALTKRGYIPFYNSHIELHVANLLADGNIVALFQGRLEYGPRALGNRSLIASPEKRETWYRMNLLKGREEWRPLAPAVMYDQQDRLFSPNSFSPFMTKNYYVKEEFRDKLEAVTHVDGTARVQSVTEHYNPMFYSIIREFYKITGIPAVVNTSFNVRGLPIVCTPDDAIEAFERIGVDYLCIGSFIVKQKGR